MDIVFLIIFWLLVLPATALLGLVSLWLVRKITALVQWRVGPPLFQPAYDVTKLFGKEILVPQEGGRFVFLLAPLVSLAAALLLALILWNALAAQRSFIGDAIVVIYLLFLPAFALSLGASASASPHASIAAARQMKLAISYGLPFILAFVVVLIKTGGQLNLASISQHATVLSVSGMLAFIAALFCVQAVLGFVPFDAAEADAELGSGAMTEYSGGLLALWMVCHAVMLVSLPFLLIVLFLGGFGTSFLSGAGFLAAFVLILVLAAGRFFAGRSKIMDIAALLSLIGLFILTGLGKYALILVVLVMIKNVNPRLRPDQTMKFFWFYGSVILAAAIVLASLGFYLNIGLL